MLADIQHAAAACSHSYHEARQQFRNAAEQCGWTLESLLIDGETPDSQDLSADIAFSEPRENLPTLLVSSGLHGVEGQFGSAVQRHLLSRWKRQGVPTGVRVVLIHALNPYGFAWSRRTDSLNCDLNRNFLVAGETYGGAPDLYRKLDGLLNPRHPPSSFDFLIPKAIYYLLRYGFRALESAVASGQYEFPQGLFYGGAEPAQMNRLLAAALPRWLSQCQRVVHLDLHTGLGPFGRPTLLQDSPLSLQHRDDYSRWFGRDAFRDVGDSNAFYQAKGSFGRWCRAQAGVEDYVFSCADFGTYSPLRILTALRAENQSHHRAKAGTSVVEKAKKNLREVFCPKSQRWRRLAIGNAEVLISRALDGLSADL